MNTNPEDASFYQWRDGDLLLNVRVQPRASSDGFAEILCDRIKIRITAPPVKGRANKHLAGFLAGVFGVSRANVRILSGDTGRNKCFMIQQPARLPDCIRQQPGVCGAMKINNKTTGSAKHASKKIT